MVAIALVAGAETPAEQSSPPAPRARVLFVGNSLTYVNDLPGMVEAVAAQAGLEGRITARAVALPDMGLEEHWNHGEALRAIQQGGWTHVVLQQGPSSLPESQAILREFTKKFAFEIRRAGAEVVLYSVWPSRARAAWFDAVTAGYVKAAADVRGILVPVGEGWRAAWRRDPSLPLYGADGFHPSPVGTYLAALMFVQTLSGTRPVALPAPQRSTNKTLKDLSLTEEQLRIVQQAAAEANAAAGRVASPQVPVSSGQHPVASAIGSTRATRGPLAPPRTSRTIRRSIRGR